MSQDHTCYVALLKCTYFRDLCESVLITHFWQQCPYLVHLEAYPQKHRECVVDAIQFEVAEPLNKIMLDKNTSRIVTHILAIHSAFVLLLKPCGS